MAWASTHFRQQLYRREHHARTAVTGTVSYSAVSKTATFKPVGSSLAMNSDFTATITTAATDLSGNALAGTTAALPAASNYVWTFKTGGVSDTIAPTVLSISPLADASNICLSKTVSATFSEPMDASTITASTVQGRRPAVLQFREPSLMTP